MTRDTRAGAACRARAALARTHRRCNVTDRPTLNMRLRPEDVEDIDALDDVFGNKSAAVRAALRLARIVYAHPEARRYRDPLDAARAWCKAGGPGLGEPAAPSSDERDE